MPRNVCISAVEGQTGFLIAELLLTNEDFSSKIDSVVGLSMKPNDPKCKQLGKLGAKIVHHQPGRVRQMVTALKNTGANTCCLIPPAHKDKFDITAELIEATKKADIPNILFISSAGCDFADARRQPRLHEFLELEAMVMATKGDPKTMAGHSPAIIRPGFYAENVLLYAPQIKSEGILPLPIGETNQFAPIALGDVAQTAGYILIGQGDNGFDDAHRGQLVVVTGPMMCAGSELATAASQALGTEIKFENISEREAKKVLQAQSDSDESEKQYLLEYYSLVREGKTNYVATIAFQAITGTKLQEPPEFFKVYAEEFQEHKHHPNKRRKVDGH